MATPRDPSGKPRGESGPDRLTMARGLATVASAPTIEESLREAARILGAISGARVSAIFHVRDGEITREAWHPGTETRHARTSAAARRAALAPADEASGSGAGYRALHAPVPSTRTAATPAHVAWVRAGGDAVPPETAPLAEAVLSLLAARISTWEDAAQNHARHEQYERWFQTLDAQLRILDRERQKFAAVVNQPDSYAFVTDGERIVRWLNKAMANLLGERGGSGEWVGHDCHEICGRLGLREGGEGCAGCPVMRAYEQNAPFHIEIRSGSGSAERDLYLTALPIRGPDGKPIEVLGQIQDVTNLEVVRRAKERLETVVSGAPIVLYAVDREGKFTLSVGKGLESLGLKPGEAVGRSVFEMYSGVPEIGDAIRRALGGETVSRTIDVGDLSFDSYYVPLRGPSGAVEGMIGVSTDVTERRRAEEALRRSEEELRHAQRIEAVGSLAGGIAHDFNNLLTALFGHLNFLRGRIAPDTEAAREVEEIGRAAERAASLTRQLLAFSRKQVLQLRSVDANEVVRGMEPMLRRLIREDVDLRIETDAADGWITADPGQVEQVVMNLAVNARDAMPGGGRLTIRTSNVTSDGDATSGGDGGREARGRAATPESQALPGGPDAGPRDPIPPGRYVVLSVRDTGTGMDAATQERAFEPFFTTKPVGAGTGLGLSTVYGIVKQSGGEIFLTSAPGSGALFTIYFPCVTPAAAPATPVEGAAVGGLPRGGRAAAAAAGAPGSVPGAGPGRETILLVEDEQMVRDLFRDVLTGAGYAVLEASGGEEALAIAARHDEPIHLMVTDVVMPGMGGGELVERMAALRPEVRVVYVSGYTDDLLVRRGILDSGVPFLQKPCMPDQLARGVRAALDAPARPRAPTAGTRSSDGESSGRDRSAR